jgi:SAM-dependent methyltransferase
MRVWKDYYGNLLIDGWKKHQTRRALFKILRWHPRGVAKRAANSFRRRLGQWSIPGRIRFGSLRRLSPVSHRFGFDRGLPIDRHYIEEFLNHFAASVKGHVLEIGDDFYSRRFGNGRVTRQDVIHVVPGMPGATIIADLTDAPQIPSEQFDCIILTQTLHFIYDLHSALSTVARILKPGGTLLVTLPGISQVCRDQVDLESDSWRFTRSSAHRLFQQHFPTADLHVQTYGNVLAATSFLYGLATSDLKPHELDHHDPDYPVTIGVRVVTPKNL